MSSRNSSRTLSLAAASAFRPSGVARYTLRSDLPLRCSVGAQIALLLQAVKQRIQTPGTDAVAVPRQFLDHAQPEDRLFDGVMQDVQADQAGVQIAVGGNSFAIGFRFRHSITNLVIFNRGMGRLSMPLTS